MASDTEVSKSGKFMTMKSSRALFCTAAKDDRRSLNARKRAQRPLSFGCMAAVSAKRPAGSVRSLLVAPCVA
jgi:hypothetical protein